MLKCYMQPPYWICVFFFFFFEFATRETEKLKFFAWYNVKTLIQVMNYEIRDPETFGRHLGFQWNSNFINNWHLNVLSEGFIRFPYEIRNDVISTDWSNKHGWQDDNPMMSIGICATKNAKGAIFRLRIERPKSNCLRTPSVHLGFEFFFTSMLVTAAKNISGKIKSPLLYIRHLGWA